jgi:hypothetical protein
MGGAEITEQLSGYCEMGDRLCQHQPRRTEIFMIAREVGTIKITIFAQGQWRYDVVNA